MIALAADLTEYGRRLSPRLLFDGPPRSSRSSTTTGSICRALLGQDVDRGDRSLPGED